MLLNQEETTNAAVGEWQIETSSHNFELYLR
jgi:hypothetical protein